MPKTCVVYHLDADGFGAAFAAWKSLGNVDVEYMRANYGDVIPEMDPSTSIFILDMSFPRQILLKMRETYASVMVLDHHETAKKDLEGLDFVKFDMTKSGAVIAWEHFNPGKPLPEILAYVQDRDLWKFNLPHSKEVNAAIQSRPTNFEDWDEMATKGASGIEELRTEGEAILRSQKMMVEIVCKEAYTHYVPGGFIIPMVNASFLWSEIVNRLLEMYPDAPFAASWYMRKDHKVCVQLRARPDTFDVGAYARNYGGGGRNDTAGFIQDVKWMRDMEFIP